MLPVITPTRQQLFEQPLTGRIFVRPSGHRQQIDEHVLRRVCGEIPNCFRRGRKCMVRLLHRSCWKRRVFLSRASMSRGAGERRK